ncbi:MAG: substrate-binding domain-containing protein [Thermoproteota archaeon]
MKKLIGVLLIGMAVLCGVAQEKPGAGLTLAFIDHGDPADPFHAKIVLGWREAAAAFGVNAIEYFAYGDVAKTVDYMYAAIAAGVNGVFVFSVDPHGLHPAVKTAVEKGIAVALMSARDPFYGPEVVPFIGFDLAEQGYTLGKYIAQQLKTAGKTKDVRVAFFAEFIAPYSALRRQGILKALDDAGVSYIAPDTFGLGEDMAKIVDTIKSYLLAHPETDVIIGLGSLTTEGGYLAMKALGYAPGRVLWYGFDLNPGTVEGIKAGYGASNVDEVFNYGFLGFIAVYLKAKYNFIVGDLPVATVMVDRSNVENFLYWVEKGIK